MSNNEDDVPEIFFDIPEEFGPSTAHKEAIAIIEGMGFDRALAFVALKSTEFDVEQALNWIFRQLEELKSYS